MRVISTVRFTMLRMLRNPIVLLLLLVLPIVLLTVFAYILRGMTAEDGTPYVNRNAEIMVLVFQLFAGSTVMHFLNYDLFTVNRMRMHVAPFNRTMYAFSIMMCGTLFSMLLGLALMIYSQLVLGTVWQHPGWLFYLVTLLAVLSSIVCVILASALRSYKLAERLSEVYGVGSVLLAGLWFPLPRGAVFDFLGTYGNPLSLAMGAAAARSQGNGQEAWLHANLLLAAIVVLFAIMALAGGRRLK